MKNKFIIGIDEVGRGPIAGPVTVCACIVFDIKKVKKLFKGVKESKQVSEINREIWFEKIVKTQKEKILDFKVISVSNKIIDKKGLSFCLKKLVRDCLFNLKIKSDSDIRLDGSLFAPKEFLNQKTIIKGDEKEISIALASIVAKVTRDRFMRKIAKKYPDYGFEIHKGYGTRNHYKAIDKLGISDIHRLTFLQKRQKAV